MKGILTQIPPDDNYHAEEDILHFMNISFDKIKQTHSYVKPFDAEWPAQDHIQEIGNKSSGQFIYAATVKKYIESNRHDPASRLTTIIRLARDHGNSPYADLDALYKHILMHLADEGCRYLVLQVFFVLLHQPFQLSSHESDEEYDHISLLHHLFNVPKNDILLALTDLSSILTVNPHGRIRLLHASFPDFLFDESRSGSFYLCADAVKISIFRASLRRIPRCKHSLNSSHALPVTEDCL